MEYLFSQYSIPINFVRNLHGGPDPNKKGSAKIENEGTIYNQYYVSNKKLKKKTKRHPRALRSLPTVLMRASKLLIKKGFIIKMTVVDGFIRKMKVAQL